MSVRAKAYVTAVIVTGAAILAYTMLSWQSTQIARFLFYALFSTAASQLKVRLPVGELRFRPDRRHLPDRSGNDPRFLQQRTRTIPAERQSEAETDSGGL